MLICNTAYFWTVFCITYDISWKLHFFAKKIPKSTFFRKKSFTHILTQDIFSFHHFSLYHVKSCKLDENPFIRLPVILHTQYIRAWWYKITRKYTKSVAIRIFYTKHQIPLWKKDLAVRYHASSLKQGIFRALSEMRLIWDMLYHIYYVWCLAYNDYFPNQIHKYVLDGRYARPSGICLLTIMQS